MKQFKMLLLSSMVMLFTACGGGSSSGGTEPTSPETPQTIAIDNIMAYADNNTQPAPTLLTYETAGVVGVTPENLDDVNNIVANLTAEQVDTTEKIQKIVDDLGINIIPISNAGSDQSILTGSSVTLDGSESYDPDSNVVNYNWSIISKQASSQAILSNPNISNPTFTADVDGEYIIQLTVNDGLIESISDTVTIVADTTDIPTADAGDNQSVLVGSAVNLDGSLSSDSDGNFLNYHWEFTTIPDSSTATLSDISSARPSFLVDEEGVYELKLTVDNGIHSSSDTVTIVANLTEGIYLYKKESGTYISLALPSMCDGSSCVKRVSGTYAGITTVTHGEYKLLAVGQDYTISNLIASDLNSITWAKFNGLIDGQVIQAGNAVEFTITSGLTGYQESKLQWSFSINGTASFMETIYFTSNGTANQAPVSDAGIDQSIDLGNSTQLDGSKSLDVDGDDLTFYWSITNQPENSNPTLSNITTDNPTFTTDMAGAYTISLIVNDGIINSTADEVTINVATDMNIINVSNTVEFRQALLDAAQNGMDDTIVLADGVYKTTDDGEGTFTFFDNEDKDLYIVGTSQENTILSGDNQNQVLKVLDSGHDTILKLEYMTIKDGYTLESGAGVWSDYTTKTKYLTVTNNISKEGWGGGLFLAEPAINTRHIVDNTQITYNRVERYAREGAGIYGMSIEITNSNISYNTNVQYRGGGASNIVSIKNSIISYNTAHRLAAVEKTGYITNCLIYNNNSTDTSGEYYSDAVVALTGMTNGYMVNSIMVNNSGGLYGGSYVVNSTFLNNDNIDIAGGSTSSISISNTFIDVNNIHINYFGDNLIYSSDPGFINADNDNYHLRSDSVLIDAGTDSYTGVTIPTTDLDGNPRPVGASTDIGPYEYQ